MARVVRRRSTFGDFGIVPTHCLYFLTCALNSICIHVLAIMNYQQAGIIVVPKTKVRIGHRLRSTTQLSPNVQS